MTRTTKGHALFYHRDSGGKAEMTPAQYVGWAQAKSAELDVSFNGTPGRIEAMIREERSVDGDLYLDYDVKGNLHSRPALDALKARAGNDSEVTHILIPRSDRLARFDDPVDGLRLENELRRHGKTLVFINAVLTPLRKNQKPQIGEALTRMVVHDHADEERTNLAQKILYAQLQLARCGYSTGGRAPYGFRRWLIKDDGTMVRELADKEHVRMAGHHVVWLPTAEAELKIIRRILEMLETMPASQVAAQLTAEAVPPPDAGRWRKDHGIRHPVSGVWHQTTVVNIARNPLLLAITRFGLRSMGDKLRFSPEGPRQLEDTDYREDEKPKIIRNSEDQQITASARFEPLVDTERHQRLLATLDTRAGTQRGKSRSRTPAQNPLGSRIFDLNCTWPMYRAPYLGSFRYTCGYYQQSHGACCSYNHVDGLTAARFMLGCLRQRMLSPTLLQKMERRFRKLAAQNQDGNEAERELAELQAEQAQVQSQLKIVSSNMALAKTPEQFDAISATFNELKSREAALAAKIASDHSVLPRAGDVESEVAIARQIVHRLAELVADSSRMDLASEAFRLTNARLFLRFRPVQAKKRLLNKVVGGAVVFGAAPDPIETYRGPTGRRALNYNGSTVLGTAEPGKLGLPSPPEATIGSGLEGKSLGNVSRGDWTPVELFRRGAASLAPAIQRLILAFVQGTPPQN